MSVRQTDSQERIIRLLQQLNREISAQALHLELRHHHQSLGLATVYRALKTLQLQGVVQTRTLNSGESLYRLVTAEQQHHLTCVRCGQTLQIEDCPICKMEATWRQLLPFKVYYHSLEFFGLCPSCSKKANDKS